MTTVVTSLRTRQEVLDELDEVASKIGVTRNAAINVAICLWARGVRSFIGSPSKSDRGGSNAERKRRQTEH